MKALNIFYSHLIPVLFPNRFAAFILTIMFSCSSTKFPYTEFKHVEINNNCQNIIFPDFDFIIFNSEIEILNKNLSGLLLLKTMEDSSTRIVFTNEFGNSYFDFQFSKDQFKVISIIDFLDKKPVIRQLKTDLGLLIGYHKSQYIKTYKNNGFLFHTYSYDDYTNTYITDTMCNQLLALECLYKNKKQTEIKCFGTKNNFPDSLFITHIHYHFNLSLKQIVQ